LRALRITIGLLLIITAFVLFYFISPNNLIGGTVRRLITSRDDTTKRIQLTPTPTPDLELTITSLGISNYPTCSQNQDGYTGQLIPSQATGSLINETQIINNQPKISKNALSERIGYSISTQANSEYWANLLGAGWYLDWSVNYAKPDSDLSHWQMIRVQSDCIYPSLKDIQQATENTPGQIWIIGNEPDVIWQDNITAINYAHVYHDLYVLIKSSDPTALIAVGGVSQSTPLRLEYLDQVLKEYFNYYGKPLPTDWWTVHGYVLREERGSWGVDIPPGIHVNSGQLYEINDHGNLDIFKSQIVAFRKWLAENGYQRTPLALTEFGILMPTPYGFPTEVTENYLTETFTWLYRNTDPTIGYPEDGYRLVQKWAWFSLSDPVYSSADLGDLSSGQLTSIGKKFRDFIIQNSP
jgi:hypothetical protein